ncbi:ankyrin repeat and SOCS box protein 11 isoform X4 [Rhinoderma darwinii]|uniref:ankyrin repeat and SOCS box protein 11 isoform X4 n=1 Tax=Rhinoderma darwinii TaxID=43563 RepID=UPI003F679982
MALYITTEVSKRRELSGITSLSWELRNALYGNHICHTFQGGSWADRSPLHDAAFHGRLLTVKTLIAQINIVTVDGITPLYNACSSGSVACVSMLLEHGAQPELETQLAFPLHEAVVRGHRECTEMLIAYGADIEKELQNKGTPLYLACAHQKTDCVKRLLELGANVNHGKQRDTPLHAAARRTSQEIVKLLIDYGANVKYKNMEGKYPIELSVPRSPVERTLMVAEGPATLAQLCRLSIRKTLGSSCLQVVPRLQLPNRLIQFLLYR